MPSLDRGGDDEDREHCYRRYDYDLRVTELVLVSQLNWGNERGSAA
jgi:hypothetical protein